MLVVIQLLALQCKHISPTLSYTIVPDRIYLLWPMFSSVSCFWDVVSLGNPIPMYICTYVRMSICHMLGYNLRPLWDLIMVYLLLFRENGRTSWRIPVGRIDGLLGSSIGVHRGCVRSARWGDVPHEHGMIMMILVLLHALPLRLACC